MDENTINESNFNPQQKRAHQLRTPLTNIMGLIALLESEELNPLNVEIIKMLKISASALDTATRTIIDHSAQQSG